MHKCIFRLKVNINNYLLLSSSHQLHVDLSKYQYDELWKTIGVVCFREISFSVLFVLIDGIIEKTIQINKGETSVNGLVNELKYKFEEDKNQRIEKIKTLLPQRNIEGQEHVKKRRTVN